MDGFTLTSLIVKAVVWPIATVSLAFIFRSPITRALTLITRIKYKDFEMIFHEGVEKIKEEAELQDSIKEFSHAENTKLQKLAQHSPKAVVLESWLKIEDAAKTKLNELYQHQEWRKHFQGSPINFILYKGALSPTTKNALQELQRLRNQIVHYSDNVISAKDSVEYAKLTNAIVNQIKGLAAIPKQHLTALTFLILNTNSLIDTGKYQDISLEEIKKEIEKGTILEFLKSRVGKDIDLSMYLHTDTAYSGFKEFYIDELQKLLGGYGGRERRKWGIENSGLCLLLAWTNEIIQQGWGWHPNEN